MTPCATGRGAVGAGPEGPRPPFKTPINHRPDTRTVPALPLPWRIASTRAVGAEPREEAARWGAGTMADRLIGVYEDVVRGARPRR